MFKGIQKVILDPLMCFLIIKKKLLAVDFSIASSSKINKYNYSIVTSKLVVMSVSPPALSKPSFGFTGS